MQPIKKLSEGYMVKESLQPEVISIYTQSEAIEDGTLVNISDTQEVKETGFKVPVIVTRGVYELLDVNTSGQSFAGRLWDLLTIARLAIKKMQKEEDYFGTFTASFSHRNYKFFIVFNEHEGYTIMFPEDY
jgi:hypothetical protein